MLHLDEAGVTVEFASTLTSYGGQMRREPGPVRTIPIPMNLIAGVQFHRRLFRKALLEVRTRRIQAVADIPWAHQGRFAVTIAGNDVRMAETICSEITARLAEFEFTRLQPE